jgi:Na+-translocating ferredoxin:NAD+ oxidoreductase RNF subunit RnfB
MTILSTTLVIAAVGLIVGCGLVFTARKFAVKVDEKESAVRAKLPGNNCGACGFAGCDALAGAIARGEAPVNACPVGGSPVAKEIGAIMGVDAADVERKVAFIACKGSCEVTKNQGNYIGIRDCRAAVMSGISVTDCSYGCLGFRLGGLPFAAGQFIDLRYGVISSDVLLDHVHLLHWYVQKIRSGIFYLYVILDLPFHLQLVDTDELTDTVVLVYHEISFFKVGKGA